jgi:hypothetical protein
VLTHATTHSRDRCATFKHTLRKQITIGLNSFSSKKDALEFYREILNSYEKNERLNSADFDNVYWIIEIHPQKVEKIGCGIDHFRVGIARYNTKSFELVRTDGSTEFFSFTKRINKPKDDFSKFLSACRHAIQVDLRNVKQKYFKLNSTNGKAKCQETGETFIYEELNVDHRQPNTFSTIVDRFVELNRIELDKIEYILISGAPNELKDKKLELAFKKYHKEKANLRIVKKELNLSRAHQGRIRTTSKDIKIS